MEHDRDLEESLNRIEDLLSEINERTKEMAISQDQFDTDLAALVTAITNLDTAVDALIASKPAADLTAEDTSVQTAAAAVAAELAKLAPAPAPGP